MNDFKDQQAVSYRNKKVLIFGLGLNQGGVGSAKFFAQEKAVVKVTDLKDVKTLKSSIDQLKRYKNIKFILGKHDKKDFSWADLIIKNPAIKPDNTFLKYTNKIGKQVEMDMGIFLQFVKPSQIIGITGTKGKSTTASLIYEVLKTKFHNLIFAGNIGTSVLDKVRQIKENSLVVLELSSFQLESFDKKKVSPKWAIITNIFPDHLNYYPSMKSYVEAKRAIIKYQQPGDTLFLNREDKISTSSEFLKNLYSKIIFTSKDDLPKSFKPSLKGEHNLANIASALLVAKNFEVEESVALSRLEKFKGVEFRMQLVNDYKGVKIYNDTAATNPDAAIAALETFPHSLLIAGGMNKNLRLNDFAKAIDKYSKQVFFLEGDATNQLKKLMKRKNKIAGVYKNLSDVVQFVKQVAKRGDVILFSPGATSFNLFQNEFDRGRKFNEAVKKVFQN
ncbi:UDP-N-acetylmuramoyl-L-alanine--D-glutamate ligase [Candidatus Daviesbacteria bacterium]|nr:UDP-N-acetylmuramoyl-L-alanine--D-glutamate ligase [Candidatus Daviesbacteria bacterium]